jgi:16S rRNA (guanine527-N7)-methyltransferase
MDPARIAELLRPFAGDAEIHPHLLGPLQLYLDLLLRWNARTNLTAVRDPEQIMTRHFGESILAARLLFPHTDNAVGLSLADIGSGAGFPGVPIKLWAPDIKLTLIESQNKKATFLREVLRTLQLDQAQVFGGRAEDWDSSAEVVTLRAVERFEAALPVAVRLVTPGGRLGLLIGESQLETARVLLGDEWSWNNPVPIPKSVERVIAIAHRIA